MVIKVDSKHLELLSQTRLYADAGVSLAAFASYGHRFDLVGFEWGPAVPGSIGGSIRGNAGAFGGETKDTLKAVHVYHQGQILIIPREDLEFRYRMSSFKINRLNDIILGGEFELEKGDIKESRVTILDFIKRKKLTQPTGVACSGCIFKNIDGQVPSDEALAKDPQLQEFTNKGIIPTGYLIDKLGLKGLKQGGVEVSAIHGNYIINPEKKGTYRDVEILRDKIKAIVTDAYGVIPEEEVGLISQQLKHLHQPTE
jgi:UDP-N-acetylmuramate dehydrogenase